MNRTEALSAAQDLVNRYLPGRRAWAEQDEPRVFHLGTWEPYDGDEDSDGALEDEDGTVCYVQAVRWTGKTWELVIEQMADWLESWDNFKKGRPPRSKQLSFLDPKG